MLVLLILLQLRLIAGHLTPMRFSHNDYHSPNGFLEQQVLTSLSLKLLKLLAVITGGVSNHTYMPPLA